MPLLLWCVFLVLCSSRANYFAVALPASTSATSPPWATLTLRWRLTPMETQHVSGRRLPIKATRSMARLPQDPAPSSVNSTVVVPWLAVPAMLAIALGLLARRLSRLRWRRPRPLAALPSVSLCAVAARHDPGPSGPPHLLVVGTVWPEPASSAAGAHMKELLLLFRGHGWRCSVASDARDTPHMMDLDALGVAKVPIKLNSDTFDEVLRHLSPDVVMFDRFVTEEQYGWRVEAACPAALRLLDTEDLHCLRLARQEAARSNQAATVEDLLTSEIAKREIASILRSDMTMMISMAEMEILSTVFRVDPSLLLYVPFMLPPGDPQERSQSPSFEQRKDFLTIGNFRHGPNWDQVLTLKTHVWPRIRRALPTAVLHVYGAYAPAKAFALHNPREGFLVHGRAEDAVVVVRQARVLLAPLRFGAGLKGKLVEAMQCGTPSVTTSIGAEGMLGTPNSPLLQGTALPFAAAHSEATEDVARTGSPPAWCGAVDDTAEGFAEAAVALHTDAARWAAAHRRGFELLDDVFDRAHHEARILDRLEEVRSDLPGHRRRNFLGGMLRHHSLKSTMYLSRWIELKERTAAAAGAGAPATPGDPAT